MVDNLLRTLQSKTMSTCEGHMIVSMTIQTPQSVRSDASFKLFWQKVEKKTSQLDINGLKLPRHQKVPRRYEV